MQTICGQPALPPVKLSRLLQRQTSLGFLAAQESLSYAKSHRLLGTLADSLSALRHRLLQLFDFTPDKLQIRIGWEFNRRAGIIPGGGSIFGHSIEQLQETLFYIA